MLPKAPILVFDGSQVVDKTEAGDFDREEFAVDFETAVASIVAFQVEPFPLGIVLAGCNFVAARLAVAAPAEEQAESPLGLAA